jgi:hypothetical protein
VYINVLEIKMPSNFTTALDGLLKIQNSKPGNKVSSTAKIPGTGTLQASNLTRVDIAGNPSVFDGSSNDGITPQIIQSTGNVGNSITFISGVSIGTADHVRKQAELTVGNYNVSNSDPLHDKTYDREVVFLASGYYHDIQGRLISPTGAVVSGPLGSATGDFRLNPASGGDRANNGMTSDYTFNYRLGGNQVNKKIEARY